jgi:hypothetical protein
MLHLNAAPLVVTMAGGRGVNVGVLHDLCPQLVEALEPLRRLTSEVWEPQSSSNK